MAKLVGGVPDDLIKTFEQLGINTEKMVGEMVQAGASVALENMRAKIPRTFLDSLKPENLSLTRVYKTPSDDGINCQATVRGYFTNRNGKVVPAPLVANLFEYGSTVKKYPKMPFLRTAFRRSQIEKAMKKVQDKYIKES